MTWKISQETDLEIRH